MGYFHGGAFVDSATSLLAKISIISGVCVLPLVLVLFILIGIADETRIVWNLFVDSTQRTPVIILGLQQVFL